MAHIVITRNPRPALPSAAEKYKRIKRFDAALDIQAKGAKAFTEVKDKDGVVLDYRDVVIKGYLSTFRHITERDRDGDYVESGAFSETIPKFMRNPVLLANHENNVKALAGRFTRVEEDVNGLYVEGRLSNAPGNIDVRFKVAEGDLRTLSMGGLFYYRDDGRGIFKVELYEGSLTPIPMNPDALVSTRSITDDDIKLIEA